MGFSGNNGAGSDDDWDVEAPVAAAPVIPVSSPGQVPASPTPVVGAPPTGQDLDAWGDDLPSRDIHEDMTGEDGSEEGEGSIPGPEATLGDTLSDPAQGWATPVAGTSTTRPEGSAPGLGETTSHGTTGVTVPSTRIEDIPTGSTPDTGGEVSLPGGAQSLPGGNIAPDEGWDVPPVSAPTPVGGVTAPGGNPDQVGPVTGSLLAAPGHGQEVTETLPGGHHGAGSLLPREDTSTDMADPGDGWGDAPVADQLSHGSDASSTGGTDDDVPRESWDGPQPANASSQVIDAVSPDEATSLVNTGLSERLEDVAGTTAATATPDTHLTAAVSPASTSIDAALDRAIAATSQGEDPAAAALALAAQVWPVSSPGAVSDTPDHGPGASDQPSPEDPNSPERGSLTSPGTPSGGFLPEPGNVTPRENDLPREGATPPATLPEPGAETPASSPSPAPVTSPSLPADGPSPSLPAGGPTVGALPVPPLGEDTSSPARSGAGQEAGKAVPLPAQTVIYHDDDRPAPVRVDDTPHQGDLVVIPEEDTDEDGQPRINRKSSKTTTEPKPGTTTRKTPAKKNMIGGIRLTARDIKMMEFLARYRTATVGQLARRFETSETALRNRLPLLDKAGLITWSWAAQTKPKIWRITEQGLKTVEMSLTTWTVSWGQLRHTLGLVDLGIAFELAGEVVLTEREIRAAAAQYTPTARLRTAIEMTRYRSDLDGMPADGLDPIAMMERVKAALILPVPGRPNGHTPDMILVRQPFPSGASGNIAIELELTRKGLDEWRKIFEAYARSTDFDKVYYFVKGADMVRSLKQVAAAVGAADKILIEKFEPVDLTADPNVTGGGA